MDSSFDTRSLTSREKEELIKQLEQQYAMANVQELLQNIIDKCFKKCISKPGVSLENSEKKCLAMCMDRFMDSYDLVSKSYFNRIKQENGEM